MQRGKKIKMKKSVILKSLTVTALLAVALFVLLTLGSCSHTHEYTDVSVLQAPTCSEVGVQRVACECGDSQIKEISKTEHTPGEWKTLYAETCITKGTKQLLCQVCGEVMKNEQVDALGHELLNYEKKEPTCFEVGHEAYQACTRCTYSTYREIRKIDHTVAEGSRPTCTEPLCCTVCSEVVEAAAGHIEIVTTGTPATCTKEGKTDYIECLICKKVLQESMKVTKRAHTVVDLPAVAATCSSVGRTAGKQCSECGEFLITPVYIAELKHTYANNKDAECDVCGHTRRVGQALCSHKNTEPFPSRTATCTQHGVTKGIKCVDCGETTESQKEVKILSHTIEIMPAVAATETKPGLTEGKRCSVCKLIITQQEIIPALSRTKVED